MKKNFPIKGKSTDPFRNTYEGLKILIEAYIENIKITEEEKTKRVAIQAKKEVEIAAIKEHSKLIQEQLKKSFKERSENFDRMFKELDEGLQNNDIKKINTYMTMIIETAKTSPLSQVESVVQKYNDPDVKEIEI